MSIKKGVPGGRSKLGSHPFWQPAQDTPTGATPAPTQIVKAFLAALTANSAFATLNA